MKTWPAILLLSAVALLLVGCDNRAAEKEQLRALFANIDNCYNNADGVGVIDLYTQSTFEYYDTLVPVILDGPRDRVERLPPGYQQEVLLARLKGTREELQGLSGRRYLAHATSRGWYALEPSRRRVDTIGGIDFVSGQEAWGQVYTDGQPTGLRICFRYEDGAWRIDEPASWERSAAAWEDQARQRGMELRPYVASTIEQGLGITLAEAVWDPMPE
jgi:hypothetical protein